MGDYEKYFNWFSKQVEFTERISVFESGNRNNFIFLLASNCCKYGIPKEYCKEFAFEKYANVDFGGNEIINAIYSAYDKNKDKFGSKSFNEVKYHNSKFKKIGYVEEEDYDYTLKKVLKPILAKRVYENKYLRKRGLKDIDFERFNIYKSKFPSIKDYVFFIINELDEKFCNGYVGRAEINTAQPKYKNSKGASFQNLLFGYTDIKPRVAILVEGVFDKIKVDHALNLIGNQEIQCYATFGKKVSKGQIKLIQQNLVTSDIWVVYDEDAKSSLKKIGTELESDFNVKIANTESKDLGEMNYKEIEEKMNNLVSPSKYNLTTINRIT